MSKQVINSSSFITIAHNGLMNKLITNVHVFSSMQKPPSRPYETDSFTALWDTGATNSMITQSVVDRCNLVETGATKVSTAGGVIESSPTFFIEIYLPNRVKIEKVKVAQGDMSGVDLLIGMDIIMLGDFAVTHIDGITSFSFRIPSSERIDFTKPTQYKRITPKVGRNSPCHCGSGKKLKDCHKR